MRRVMRRTVAAVGVWGVLLACWLSVDSPAWSQVAGKAAGAASRDPAIDSHLPWIFRERSQIVLDENVEDSSCGRLVRSCERRFCCGVRLSAILRV